MTEPFRSTACAQCGALGTLPSFCIRCGSARCVRCANGDVCPQCLSSAFEVLRAAMRGNAPGPAAALATPPRPNRAGRVLSVASFSAAFVALAMSLSVFTLVTRLSPHPKPPPRGIPMRHMPFAMPPPAPATPFSMPMRASVQLPPPPPVVSSLDPRPTRDLPLMPSVLMQSAPGVHEPLRLVSLARRLANAGFDLTIVPERLGGATIRALDRSLAASGMSATPVFEGDQPVGLRLEAIAPGSVFADLGLRNGDLLTSINGYAMPGDGSVVLIRTGHWPRIAVAEVVRARRHLVFAFSWTEGIAVPRGAPTRLHGGTTVARSSG